ncbi:Aspartate--tRNA ligase [Buchnera aphidicola (Pterocallis alni)]|uniref:aspartate--tRNA ligase n=1 Tax=Buchnera aphidicola TaxID=9 RepID=UPI00346404B2
MRTKYCGDIISSDIGKIVKLCGWVHNIRKFKHFIFVDIRDTIGIVQVLFNNTNSEIFEKALTLTQESCIQIIGIVQKKKKKNEKIKTGNYEINAQKIKIFNYSSKLPLEIHKNNDDVIRLKYRYLDLRNHYMLQNLKIRNKIVYIITQFMQKNNFINIETPMLTKSTPEGAKDYLIPSNIHIGKYYALPQSPQLFKQLLMISGIEKYYQIVKCFRNEDLRSDRQPEFTQIDIEASFIKKKKMMNIIENMIKILWKEIINYQLNTFPTLTFQKSIEKYGTDKPDLRIPTKIINIDHLKWKSNIIDYNNNIKTKSLIIKKGIFTQNKKKINKYTTIIKKSKNIFFTYIYVKNLNTKKNGIISSNINFTIHDINTIIKTTKAYNGDIILIIHGKQDIVNKILSYLRIKTYNIQKYQHLWKPVWIIDFPLFTKNEYNQFTSTHHPFTAPKSSSIEILQSHPELAISKAYDLVINGYEIGGGSVRIHKKKIQKKIFKILGIKKNNYQHTFDFFINALKYGTPPHLGIALGLDRITMLLTNTKNIKDVIAFPKTNSAVCIMTGAPSKNIY